MRRTAIIAGLLPTALVAVTAAASEGQTPAPPPAETAASPPPPTVVSRITVRPRRITRRHRFAPWAQPTPGQVHRIVRLEAARWGASASHLSSRISCETGGTFAWDASNGQYQGLGQFAYSTFTRGLSTIRTRRVRFARRSSTIRRARVVTTYSDGSRRTTRGRRYRVPVRHVYRGRIPRRPAHTHGWAQVRIMAQAMAGRSAVRDSEWQCR